MIMNQNVRVDKVGNGSFLYFVAIHKNNVISIKHKVWTFMRVF